MLYLWVLMSCPHRCCFCQPAPCGCRTAGAQARRCHPPFAERCNCSPSSQLAMPKQDFTSSSPSLVSVLPCIPVLQDFMWEERYHLLGNLMLHRHAFSSMAARGSPVGPCVIDGAQRGEAMIVQAAVRHSGGLEEGPHICIRPPQDGIHPHERRPASAAGAELILAASIRITPAARLTLL